MRYILIVGLLLSGCSNFGELEALNTVGLGEVGEIMRATESSRIILGNKASRASTAPVVNRTQGEIESIIENQDRLEIKNLPHTIAQVKYVITNTRSVGEDLGK